MGCESSSIKAAPACSAATHGSHLSSRGLLLHGCDGVIL